MRRDRSRLKCGGSPSEYPVCKGRRGEMMGDFVIRRFFPTAFFFCYSFSGGWTMLDYITVTANYRFNLDPTKVRMVEENSAMILIILD